MKNSPQSHESVLIPINTKDVAVAGLIWQPLTNLKNLQKEAKQLVYKEHCECFLVHHRNKSAQCGMLPLTPGEKNYYSIALMLIDKLGDSWLAVFLLKDNRYLLIGVEGGLVVPGCDAVFATSEEVIERFVNYKELFNWQTTYAPPQLGLSNDNLNIEQLLKSVTPKISQRILYIYDLNRKSKRMGICIVICLVIVLVIFGIWYFYQNKAHEKSMRLAMLRAQKAAQNSKSLKKLVEVWRQQPPADELISHCVRYITQYPLTLGGWQVAAVYCDKCTTKAIYQRQPLSTVNSFVDDAVTRYKNHYRFLKNSEQAQIEQSVHISGSRTQEQLQPITQISRDILSKMQQGNATGKIEDILSTNLTKKNARFELSSKMSPLLLLQDVNLDGVVVNNLTTTITPEGEITWKITGVIYGK